MSKGDPLLGPLFELFELGDALWVGQVSGYALLVAGSHNRQDPALLREMVEISGNIGVALVHEHLGSGRRDLPKLKNHLGDNIILSDRINVDLFFAPTQCS